MKAKHKLAFSAVILNGGQAIRFGGIDKQLLEINGEPIGFALAEILVQSCEDVLIVGKKNAMYEPLGIRQIEDAASGIGPAGGLLAGMTNARRDWIFLCAIDMPFFSYALSKYMFGKALSRKAEIVVCQYGGELQPFFALYHRRLAGVLATYIASGAKRSLKRFIASQPCCLVSEEELQDIGNAEAIFTNINNQDSLNAARQLAFEHGLFMDTRL